MTAAQKVGAGNTAKTSAQKIAALYAAIGGDYDPFGMLWRNADPAARRVLLKIAGKPENWHERTWSEIAGEHRAEIKRRAQQMQGWLNQFMTGMA